MPDQRIARLLIGDCRNGFCVRPIDVIVPLHWDGREVLDQAPSFLPDKMTQPFDDPGLVQFFPMDDDEVFADWSCPSAKRGQLGLFAHA